MVTKNKINLKKVMAALNTRCPKCRQSIPPDKIQRIDSSRVQCLKCGERFTPGAGAEHICRGEES